MHNDSRVQRRRPCFVRRYDNHPTIFLIFLYNISITTSIYRLVVAIRDWLYLLSCWNDNRTWLGCNRLACTRAYLVRVRYDSSRWHCHLSEGENKMWGTVLKASFQSRYEEVNKDEWHHHVARIAVWTDTGSHHFNVSNDLNEETKTFSNHLKYNIGRKWLYATNW